MEVVRQHLAGSEERGNGAEADGLGRYLRKIRAHRRPTATEELELAATIARHRQAKQEAFLQGESLLTCQAYDAALTLAKQRLVEHNLWLVTSIAYRRRHSGVPLADLIQEGNLGLMRAVDHFDHHRGLRFSTYATWWVRKAISQAISCQGRTVRLPMNMQGAIFRYERAVVRLQQSLNRKPSGSEVRQDLGIDEATATRLLCSQQSELSLQARPLGEDSASIEEKLSDPRGPDPLALTNRNHIAEVLAALLDRLNAHEQTVVRRRFGFEDGERETLAEIAADLRLSRQRILQIEQKALGKLRKRARARGLRGTSLN